MAAICAPAERRTRRSVFAMNDFSSRRVVNASGLPPAIGPYSHAVVAGDLLLCSGQLPLDPATGELDGDDAVTQVVRCLRNLDAVCQAARSALVRAAQVTVYLVDMEAFPAVNEAYATFFDEMPPARVTVGVAALPRGARVEVAAIVALDGVAAHAAGPPWRA